LAPTAADEAAVRAIPLRMADAWNRGDADAFAAPFTENADFVAFEGTHLEGRAAIAAFHTRIFAEEVRGTRLEAEAKFVRFLGPEMAVLHATARVALAGQDRPSPSRDSMQLFVARKLGTEWRVEAVMNARRLSLDRQLFLDALDALPPAGRKQVEDLVAALTRPAASPARPRP